MPNVPNESLLSVSKILKILNIPCHRLTYLFESRKLKVENFTTLDNGQRVFRQSDLNKIRQALSEVESR
jgi:hypothetical protein